MPLVTFIPDQVEAEVDENTKLLVAGRRSKSSIRFGCASCKCGTCAVKIDSSQGSLNEIDADERKMLDKLRLSDSPDVRMACKARVMSGNLTVDLEFQNQYDIPDEFE